LRDSRRSDRRARDAKRRVHWRAAAIPTDARARVSVIRRRAAVHRIANSIPHRVVSIFRHAPADLFVTQFTHPMTYADRSKGFPEECFGIRLICEAIVNER